MLTDNKKQPFPTTQPIISDIETALNPPEFSDGPDLTFWGLGGRVFIQEWQHAKEKHRIPGRTDLFRPDHFSRSHDTVYINFRIGRDSLSQT